MTGRRSTDFVLDPRRVGLAIRSRRTDAGQRRADVPLADETLRAIEVGKALPSLDTAVRLADHYGCSLDDLVGRTAPVRDGAGAATPAHVNTTSAVSSAGAVRG